MVKVYYSYAFHQAVGFASSRNANFVIDHHRKLIVAASSQYIILLSLKTGQVLHLLHRTNYNLPVRHIHLSSNRIYAAEDGGAITVWDIDSRQLLFTLEQHVSTVAWLFSSQDQTRLVSGGQDGHIILWDLLSEQNSSIKSAHNNAITQVELATLIFQGKPTNVVLSTGKDGFFKIWDAETRLCLSVIATGATQATAFAYSPQRALVFVGTNKEQISIVKLGEGEDKDIAKMVGTIKRKNYTRCQQLSIENNKIYLLTQKKLQTYELLSEQKAKQRQKRVISRKKQKAEDVEEIIPQVNTYEMQVSVGQQKALLWKVYNFCLLEGKVYLNNGRNISELSGQKPITQASERTLQLEMDYPYLVQRTSTQINVFNYGNFTKLYSIDKKVTDCSLFNSAFLLMLHAPTLSIWNLASNECLLEQEGDWSGCWAKAGKALLWKQNELGQFQVGSDRKGRVKIRQTARIFFQDKIIRAIYGRGFQRLAVSLQNNQIHIQYGDTGKNALKLYGHKLPITDFDISSDGALLVSASVDKDIRIWDLDFGHCIKSIFAHSQAVTAVKFLKDTHYVISGSKDGHIKFWDADTYQLIQDLDQNILEVKTLAVSSAADFILAGGLDGGFRIWNQTGDQTVAGDQDQKNAEKVLIQEYANEKFKQRELKTRYEDLKHGEEIIQALEQKQQPLIIMKLLRKIPPSNLKSSLSFLHATHRQKLQKILSFFVKQGHELQLCWRVLEAMERGSQLTKDLRSAWQRLSVGLRASNAALTLIERALKQQKQLSF